MEKPKAVTGLAQPPGGAPERPRDLVDSYDQDLVWIVNKLVGRVGAEHGVICRYLALEPYGTAIAVGDGFPVDPADLLPSLTSVAAKGLGAEAAAGTEYRIGEMTLGGAEQPDSYRMLILVFSPSPSVDIVAAMLRKDAAEPYSEMQLAMARTYYPVLSRYVRLWWLHREERSRAAAFQAALDMSDVGIFLLDRNLELMFANARARALLDRGLGIARAGRYLAAESPDDGMKLQAALHHSLNYNLGQHRAPDRQPAPLLTLERGDGGRSLIVTVLGLDKVAVDARDAAVILYAIDPTRDFSRLIEPLCRIYRLTKVETRLAYLLTSGMPLATAAETMNVQEATARSYLKQIFIKTRTNRQADLMRLLLSSLQHINPAVDLDPH
ncbi:MAG TPA: PAS domain-containing protein [Steroidobacteraceae bacterium]|nr:PAS domain-containing protein [Steroidobacteraceae bacterium]